MNPVAFSFFGWPVRWYGIFISVGILLGILIAIRVARKRGLDEDTMWNILLWAIPVSVLSARLYYVIFEWQNYVGNFGEIFAVWHGGLAIHGAILGGILTVVLCCRHYKWDFFIVADCFAPGLILGQAIGRWGNFVNGEAHGYATNLPWAINVNGEMVHPTFLYESLWDIGIFILLVVLLKKDKEKGNLFLIYLMLYSVGRFFIEMLRTDSLMIGFLRQAQVISLVLFAAALVIYLWRKKKQPKAEK